MTFHTFLPFALFAPFTELIWLASKSKKYFFDYELARELNGGKQMRNLWTISATRHLTKHPTEKPESLLRRIILIGSKEGDTVLDPFMGSGTTGAVAKQLGRNFIGIEIDGTYFDIATRRIENAARELDLDPLPVFSTRENRKIESRKLIYESNVST